MAENIPEASFVEATFKDDIPEATIVEATFKKTNAPSGSTDPRKGGEPQKGIGSPAAATLSFLDTIVGTAGIPLSWGAFLQTLVGNPFTMGDMGKARAALETTREWATVRKSILHYGEKLGLNKQELEDTVYDDNFMDRFMQWIDEKGLEPLTKKMGYPEGEPKDDLLGVGKTLAKDSLGLGVPLAAGKALSGLRPKPLSRPSVADEVRAAQESQAAATEATAPIKPPLETEMFPARGEQLEMQFGTPESSAALKGTALSPDIIEAEFAERQGTLPLEAAKGQGVQEDFFAPLTPSKDVDITSAKNPYLDPTSVQQGGFQEPPIKTAYPLEPILPNIGTLNDSSATIEQSRLPFKLSGERYDKEGIKIPSSKLKEQGGWVKLPGGNYHPKIYKFWSEALGAHIWSEKAAKNYINKYLGTERDPLKNIVLPSGDTWETVTDAALKANKASLYKNLEELLSKGNVHPADLALFEMERPLRELAKKDPEADVWRLSYGSGGNYDAKYKIKDFLHHVRDYVRNHVPPEELKNYDFVRAVRETIAQDERQAKAMAKATAEKAHIGVTTVKEYPDKFKWVEVGNIKTIPEGAYGVTRTNLNPADYSYTWELPTGEFFRKGDYESRFFKELPKEIQDYIKQEDINADALKHETDTMGHCVGGYCEIVRNGESRIFSLRDPNGMSHVTIEVQDYNPRAYGESSVPEKPTWYIYQIKGKQNKPPIDKYIPYIQDFIKSNKYEVERDLDNARMGYVGLEKGFSLPPVRPEENFRFLESKELPRNVATKEFLKDLEEILGGPGYYTWDEMYAAIDALQGKNKEITQKMGVKGPGKSQGGWIQLPTLFKSSPEAVKRKLNQLSSPYKKLEDLIKDELRIAIETKKPPKDLTLPDVWNVNTVTTNAVPMVTSSPYLTYLVSKIRGANLSYNTTVHAFAKAVSNFEKLAVSPDAEARVLAVAVELQKEKYQTYGKSIGIPEATDAQLVALGLKPDEIGAYRKTREINDMALQILKASRKQLDGTDLETPVWAYHPRSRGIGDHALAIFDKATHMPVYVRRFPTYKDMAIARKEVIEDFKKDNILQNYEIDYTAKAKDWSNPFAEVNSITLPEAVRNILAGLEEKIETRSRTFEMQRIAADVGGIVQYLKDGTPDPSLKDNWLAYLKNVAKFQKNVELFELQRELINFSDYYFKDLPRTHAYAQNLIQSELGANISWAWMEGLKKFIAGGYNEYKKTALALEGKLISPDDYVISNRSIERAAKTASAFSSAATLLFNAPNALVNAIQLPLTGIVGLPLDVVGRLRASPQQLLSWSVETNTRYMQSVLELSYSKATGKMTESSRIVDKYGSQGLIRATMFDEISELSEGSQDTTIRRAMRVLNTGKKWTNDFFIEQPVNATALLYYDILVNKVAKDHLSKAGVTKAQLEELPIILAKSWVGEYSTWAKPMYLKKLGVGGQTVSNFSNWSHNQWGRFVEAFKNLAPENDKSLFTQLGFMVGMWYLYAQLAGGKNSPILSTLDTIRNTYNSFVEDEENKLPDANYFAKEYGIPNMLFPQDTALDKAQEMMGIENPIDLSSGQRFANPIQINTLTYEFMWGLGKTAKLGMNMLWPESAAWGQKDRPIGVTRKQILSSTEKMPHLVRGYLTDKYATFDRPDGSRAVDNKYDTLAYTQQNETEEWMNKLGIKTTRQRKEREKALHNKITQKKLEAKPARFKEYILSQITEYLADKENSFADETIIAENINRLEALDPDWAKTLEQDLINKYGKMLLLPEEQIQLDASKTKKVAKLKRLKEMFDRLGLYD